jgi:hypothetical protein
MSMTRSEHYDSYSRHSFPLVEIAIKLKLSETEWIDIRQPFLCYYDNEKEQIEMANNL